MTQNKYRKAAPAISEGAARSFLPTLPESFDIDVPATDEARIELFNRADTMTMRVETEGRWLCGKLLHGCKLSSAQISESLWRDHGRRVAVRNIDYCRQLYKKIPELADVKLLTSSGLSWTVVREMLTLDEIRQLPQFVEGVRTGIVNGDNAGEALEELKGIVYGGTHGEPGAVDAKTPDPSDVGGANGEAEAGGDAEFEAEATAAKLLRALEKVHTQVEGVSDGVYNKLTDEAADIPKECRSRLLAKLEEIAQEATDVADLLDGVRNAARGVFKARTKKADAE